MSMTYSLQSDNDRRRDSARKRKKAVSWPKKRQMETEKPTQSPMSVLNKLLIYCYYIINFFELNVLQSCHGVSDFCCLLFGWSHLWSKEKVYVAKLWWLSYTSSLKEVCKKSESKTAGQWRIKPQQSTNIMDLSWYSMSDSFIIQRERDMTNLGKS